VEITGKSLAALEKSLREVDSQKRIAIELGISEGELSKQISNLKRSCVLIERLGLVVVEADIYSALRKLLKDTL